MRYFVAILVSAVLFLFPVSSFSEAPDTGYYWMGHWFSGDQIDVIYGGRQPGVIVFCGVDIDGGATKYISPQTNPGQDPCAVAADAVVGNVDEAPLGITNAFTAYGLECLVEATQNGGSWDNFTAKWYVDGAFIRVTDICNITPLDGDDDKCWEVLGESDDGVSVSADSVHAVQIDTSADDDVDHVICFGYVFWEGDGD